MRGLPVGDQRIGSRKLERPRLQPVIGAGRNDNLVFAGWRNRDQRCASRSVGIDDTAIEIDLTLTQQHERLVCSRIGANACNQFDVGAEAPRRERLVRAFTAGKTTQFGAGHSLSGCRQP